MGAVFKLVGGGVLAVVLGILLYQVPDMDWYLPLPAFLVAPLLIGLGVVHWRNLRRKDQGGTEPGVAAVRPRDRRPFELQLPARQA
jgi:hypothetical protein